MAYLFALNNKIVEYYQEHWQLKNLLVQQGWTVLSSSTGNAAQNPQWGAGDFWSSPLQLLGTSSFGGSGNPPYNSFPWIRLQCPAGPPREIMIQSCIFFNNTGGEPVQAMAMYYSPKDKFLFSASLTNAPVALDQFEMSQGGSNANLDNGAGCMQPGLGYSYIVTGGASENYSFCVFGVYYSAGNNVNYSYFGDGMIPGSGMVGDPDPFVVGYGGLFSFARDITNSGINASYYSGSTGDGMFGNYAHGFLTQKGAAAFSANAANLPPDFSGKDPFFPIAWCRTLEEGTPMGFKGLSSLMRWNGWQARSNFTIVNEATSSDRIYVQSVSLPWSGSAFLLL